MPTTIQYRISCLNAQQRYIQFSAMFPCPEEHLSLHLASWR
ncbi:MAG: hypothetical protein RL293_996, partial [Bacteroidota bacterium]